MLLKILLIVAVGALLAFLITKFIPLKLRWLASLLLLGAAVFLGLKIYQGIMNPIKFKKEKEVRYAKVIDQLKLIRDAQERFKLVNRRYSNNETELINFVKTGKLAITETKNVEKTISKGGGITEKISVRKVDTVGYEDVSKYFKGRDLKNLFSVPDTDKKFHVEVGTVEKVKTVFVPVFIAKVKKIEVLKGMNENEIKRELLAIQSSEVKGEYISVGSLTEVSVSGNWPPLYDEKDKKDKKEKKKKDAKK